jgi:hypothetical protein
MSPLSKRLLFAASLLVVAAVVIGFSFQHFNYGITNLASAIWGS